MPGVVASTAPAPKPETGHTRLVAFVEWEAALRTLLAAAVASKPLWEQVQKMDAWLAANEWHELAPEREKVRDQRKAELRRIENRLFEQAAKVSRLQAGLGDAAKQGLEALTRMELTPHVAQVWAIEARKIGKTNLVEIADSARESLYAWIDEEAMP